MIRYEKEFFAQASRRQRHQEGLIHRAWVSWAIPAILLCLLTTSCNIRVRMGHRPDIDVLETLRVGISTPNDVLSALGQPFGRGKTMLPIDSKPRTMWSYYYQEGDLTDARAIYLFVYFDEDRYDGYMWFSSLLSKK